MKKILLIIEPNSNGHHASYLKWIIEGAINNNYVVCLATFEETLSHPLIEPLIKQYHSSIILCTLPNSDAYCEQKSLLDIIKREFFYYNLFKEFYQKAIQLVEIEWILLPYLDYCTYAIALLGAPFDKVLWSGIVMRPSFHYQEMGVIAPNPKVNILKKYLFFHLLKQSTLKTIFTLDETLADFFSKKKLARKLTYLPDPSDILDLKGSISKEEARQQLNIPQDAFVVLVYGAISLRKGVDILLSMMQQSITPESLHILLAGQQAEEVKILLAQPIVQYLIENGRLHQMDKLLNKEEEYSVFIASNIVWLVYRNHYTMSAVLVQAAQMGLPVIACVDGLIEYLTRKKNLGIILYEDISFERIKCDCLNQEKYSHDFLSENNIANFIKTLLND